MQDLAYNPVLVFKNQGDEQGDECENIGKADFLLAFQTEYQRDVMLQYGSNVICMDDTHGTNAYDFSLITVLVIDSHGEGIPVAWAISNRVDVSMLVEFLKPLKARVGVINPAVFMSDMADQFYTAWVGVFGASESRQLYCAWHVDKAWRKALTTHVEGKEAKIEVYHHLRVLLQETEEPHFVYCYSSFYLSCWQNILNFMHTLTIRMPLVHQNGHFASILVQL